MSYANIEQIPDPHNLDIEAEENEPNEYREASMRYLQVITSCLDWVTANDNPRLASYAVAYALGIDTICQGRSMSDLAQDLGCSVAALSKQIKQFRKTINLGNSAYVYTK